MTVVSMYNSCHSQNMSNTSNWKLYNEVTGLQIYTQEIACHDDQNGIHQQFVVFQFINTTSDSMKVSWQKELWYNDVCQTCGMTSNNENTFSIMLAPGESAEGNCDKTSPSGLKIFSHFLNTVRGSKLTKFEFKNLVVSFK